MPCCINLNAFGLKGFWWARGDLWSSKPVVIHLEMLWPTSEGPGDWSCTTLCDCGPGEVEVLGEEHKQRSALFSPSVYHLYFPLFPRFPHCHPFFPLQYYPVELSR